MFTGIIENLATVTTIRKDGTNIGIWLTSPLAETLKVDQSLSHDGICLTVEAIEGGKYHVTAIEETVLKTNISYWQKGTKVNLERSMLLNGRLDGHIVQGHVDTIALCLQTDDKNGSREITFEIARQFAGLIIEKGSIAVNGVSLTIFNVTDNTFKVAIIPYTIQHTNIGEIKEGDSVNIEFDMIGKYVNRINSLQHA